VSLSQALEALLARALAAAVRTLPRRAALLVGARLGDVARVLGIRRRVALANLELAFPERSAGERQGILAAHYRDVGMMMCEAARGVASVHAREGEVIAHARGLEHLEAAKQAGRGAIVLTAHYGDFGLLGGWLGRLNQLMIFGKALQNPAVEALLVQACEESGVRRIVAGSGLRPLVAGLRKNHWAMMLADQDAGKGGVFVPFMGRLCSTTPGPAEISLRTGAPIIMAFITRRDDDRNEVDVLPPLVLERPGDPGAVERLTALHTAVLERWVRMHPHLWFWLHRRWKTPPPLAARRNGDDAGGLETPPGATPIAREA
jgi:Kdo2-lipid IVA lauroyltransferase/acyltransferase